MTIQDIIDSIKKSPPWKVGTKSNPDMFSNASDKTREMYNLERARTNFIRNNGSRIKMSAYRYSLPYDWTNEAHQLFASIDYVTNSLKEEVVVDYGDKDYQFFLKLADDTEYPESAIY